MIKREAHFSFSLVRSFAWLSLLSLTFLPDSSWAKPSYEIEMKNSLNPHESVRFEISNNAIRMSRLSDESETPSPQVALGEFLLKDAKLSSSVREVVERLRIESKSTGTTSKRQDVNPHFSIWINNTRVERDISVQTLASYLYALAEVVRTNLWNGKRIAVAVGPGPLRLYVEKIVNGRMVRNYFETPEKAGCQLLRRDRLVCRTDTHSFTLAVEKSSKKRKD